MNCRFSILIPSYKAKFLKEAIQSCLDQSYNLFEVIVVNDNSPEDLDSIVTSFLDDRMHYYKNKRNCGALNVVDNWNICLSYAKGEYIICMGDDDCLESNCLDELNRLIEKYPNLGVYHSRTVLIDESSDIFDIQEERPEYESSLSLIWHRWNCRHKQYIGDFCYNAKKLKENGGFYFLPMAWGADDISAIIAANSLIGGIANTSRPIFRYRVNSQTISKSGSVDSKIKALEGEREWYLQFINTIEKNEKELTPIDQLYLTLIKNKLPMHFKTKLKRLIALDMNKSSFKLFYWINNRAKYHLSFSQVLDCYFDMLRNKFKS